MPVPACQPSSIWGGKKLSRAACSIGPRDWKWNRASWPKRKNWLNKQIWLFLALKPKPLQTWMPVSTLQNIFITATDSICFMGLLCSHLKSCSKSSQPTKVFGQSRKHATIASLFWKVCFQLLKWPCHRLTSYPEQTFWLINNGFVIFFVSSFYAFFFIFHNLLFLEEKNSGES